MNSHNRLLDALLWPFRRSSALILIIYVILIGCALLATRYVDVSIFPTLVKEATTASEGCSVIQPNPVSQGCSVTQPKPTCNESSPITTPPTNKTEFPLECVRRNYIQTCPTDYPTTSKENISTSGGQTACPEYFQWIHEDLRPWKTNGITREMVEAAKDMAYFRLVVVDGKPFLEKYKPVYQTRDVFTIWGILQLLRLYPGKLPDLDIMFECADKPVVKKENYTDSNFANAPPLFHYCGDDTTLDIVFPDWSFWGWPEINVKPWDQLKKDLKEGTMRVKWEDRRPHAFWKGNPYMGNRMSLIDCNSTEWNAYIVNQDWGKETKLGFKTSNLADQCDHRYKIYIEGFGWSVSQKYILACDSMTLLVMPEFYEFFTRSLQPLKHFWPINPNNLCSSIKFAVDWGNRHSQRAQNIGQSGSWFIQNELQMKYVYDYMFHLLDEYGKLLRYKPTVPPGATEVCSETLACACPMAGLDRQFKTETLVKKPSTQRPCAMPPSKDAEAIKSYFEERESVVKNVELLTGKGDPGVDV